MNKILGVKREDIFKDGFVKCASCSHKPPKEELPKQTDMIGPHLNTICPVCGAGALMKFAKPK